MKWRGLRWEVTTGLVWLEVQHECDQENKWQHRVCHRQTSLHAGLGRANLARSGAHGEDPRAGCTVAPRKESREKSRVRLRVNAGEKQTR